MDEECGHEDTCSAVERSVYARACAESDLHEVQLLKGLVIPVPDNSPGHENQIRLYGSPSALHASTPGF